ncbi:MAG TPA: DUF2911 domain-containing protein [Cyclobacteriaceae bacterium]|nr:DUF2911 domain-containing protein [Cyclobacteriaceae bacterium]
MKTKSITLTAFLSIAAMLVCVTTWAQSPAATATGKLSSGANITVKYSSPSVKGRKVWGELVPYGKVWRAGANEATIVETDKDITVGGKTLPKGKYSLYAMPTSEKDWTIYLNSQTGQWGITRAGETTRDAAKDVAEVKVTSKKSASMNEGLKYVVNADGISLIWDNLEVPIPVK